ncbi:unnamed protein product [Gongylonema pulchrum]|uniref:MADF domain-containing protein n=1 Tax=Gongylonema pulchrum TaxID=637853 RepID=A0A183EU90_9BILA|nr:unnamed protein product [Gongylonema pulchrum]
MRRTWKFAYNRAKQLNAYCRAYRRKLLSQLEASVVPTKNQRTKYEEKHDASSTASVSGHSIDDEFPEETRTTTSVSTDRRPSTLASRKVKNSEDLILMKQIERDANYTYHVSSKAHPDIVMDLQLFRETVFRRILAEKDAQRSCSDTGFQTDDESFETIDIR